MLCLLELLESADTARTGALFPLRFAFAETCSLGAQRVLCLNSSDWKCCGLELVGAVAWPLRNLTQSSANPSSRHQQQRLLLACPIIIINTHCKQTSKGLHQILIPIQTTQAEVCQICGQQPDLHLWICCSCSLNSSKSAVRPSGGLTLAANNSPEIRPMLVRVPGELKFSAPDTYVRM